MLIFTLIVSLLPLLVNSWIFPFNLVENLIEFFRKKNTTEAFCKFELNEDIPVTPLLLTTGDEPSIVYPDDNNILKLQRGEQLRLTCINKPFNRTFAEGPYFDIIATCVGDNFVSVDDEVMPLNHLECLDFPEPTIKKREEQTCYGNHTLVDVGYECDYTFLKIYTACFDETSEDAIYTWYDSSMLHHGRQYNVPRPHFSDKELYTFTVDTTYSFHNQRQWLAMALRSDDLADRFIVNDHLHYLSRGHLTPKADFVYGFEQAATFHFINAAPQWQTFNAGNWERLETGLRELLVNNEDRYRVVTGIYGVATLPDVNNTEKELYLYTDENNNPLLKVPKFYWKIIYDLTKDTGVVIIGVNNPYLKSIPKDYIICRNICNRIRWLPTFRNDISKGYIYCCDMDEFLQVTGFDTTFMQ